MGKKEEVYEISRIVYEKMGDSLSKETYAKRMLYNLTGDEKYLNELIMCNEVIQKIINWVEETRDKKHIIYGAGDWGTKIATLLKQIKWDYFIDKKKAGEIINGIKVISFDEIQDLKEDVAILISMQKEFEEIENCLLDIGIGGRKVLTLARIMKEMKQPYFEDFLPHSDNEVFVDAGVYDGGTTLDFIKWSKNYKKIYMFEPSMDYYNRFFENVKYVENCDWIKKGLWSYDDVLKFYEGLDHDLGMGEKLSGINSKYKYSEGKWIDVPVTSLDRTVNHKVTFIKMDIEGSEMEALKGCENIIRKYRPKLAICLYHKLEDPWEIPRIILEYNPEYKIYVRHYSFDMLDTVLYAF